MSKKKHRRPLTSQPATSGYYPLNTQQWFNRPRDLPPFSFTTIRAMLVDPTIRLGLAMRAAPLCGARFAYQKPGSEDWTEGIQAESPIIAAYVMRQLKRLWRDIPVLLTAQTWGWAGAEVVYNISDRGEGFGFIEVDRLLDRHAMDVRALVDQGEACGVRFLRIKGVGTGYVDLPFPKGIFHTHAPDPGMIYGTSVCQGAYSPWADKWLNGGALDTRRLFMHKDAYRGAQLSYPHMFYEIGDKQIPARDIAREIVEQAKAGDVVTFPSDRDADGNPRWEYKEIGVPANPQHILQYPKDLDTEMLRGMECPDDIFTADTETSGAWAGKQVPMQAFYTGLDLWLTKLLKDVDRQLMRPLVEINFGPGCWYEIDHKPLGVQAMEQQSPPQGKPEGQRPAMFGGFGFSPGGGDDGSDGGDDDGASSGSSIAQRPQRMSLDPVAAVGQGVLSAAELVKAAKVTLATRLSTEPHSYSSTQFNLPPELAFEVRQLGDRIPFDDLAEDGRELQPHVTVKYGLHADSPDDVRAAVYGEPPVAIQFGPASYFEGAEYDVVKIEIQSKGLHSLNALLAESLPHTDTYPDYKPHVTIAYVKKGLGEKYAATLNDLEGRTAVFDRMVFSDKQRNWTSIPLIGKSTRFSTEHR